MGAFWWSLAQDQPWDKLVLRGYILYSYHVSLTNHQPKPASCRCTVLQSFLNFVVSLTLRDTRVARSSADVLALGEHPTDQSSGFNSPPHFFFLVILFNFLHLRYRSSGVDYDIQ